MCQFGRLISSRKRGFESLSFRGHSFFLIIFSFLIFKIYQQGRSLKHELIEFDPGSARMRGNSLTHASHWLDSSQGVRVSDS